jgi:hypothetical protein
MRKLPICCVSILALGFASAGLAAGAPPARPMLVRATSPCPKKCEWIAIQGVIDRTTAEQLSRLLATLGRTKPPIFLNSPGGDVSAAMAMGEAVRAHGLDTAIAATRLRRDTRMGLSTSPPVGEVVLSARGFCASACSLVFAGGTRRYAPLETSLGLHQMVRPEQDAPQKVQVYETQTWTQNGAVVARATRMVREETHLQHLPRAKSPEAAYGAVGAYFAKMGVDAAKAVALMKAETPEKMSWLTAAQIAQTRLATERKRADALLDF